MSTEFLLLVAATILLTYYIYTRLIRPYQSYKFMSRAISSLYKAHVDPYYIIFPPLITQFKSDYYKYGDSLYSSKLRDCQLALSMIGTNLLIILYDPELIREFYQKSNEGTYYIKSTKSPVMSAIKYIMGKGLLFSEGAQWKQRRQIMNSVFNFDFIKAKLPLISRLSKETFDKFEDFPENQLKFQIQMDLNLAFQQIFGNVITKTFFGDIQLQNIENKSIFAYSNKMLELNTQRSSSFYSKMLGPRFLNLNLRKVDKLVTLMSKQFTNYAKNIVSQQINNFKRQNPQTSALTQQQKGRSSLIDILLKESKLKDETLISQNRKVPASQTSYYYTNNDLIEQFKTFFLAGRQKASNLTCSLVYQLAQNKDLQERLKKQINDVLGDDLLNITYEQLRALKELDKCLKETQRMYTPAPALLSRQALQDHYIGEIPIKKGTLITVSILGNHFNSKFYQNPEVFNPDRWDHLDMKEKPNDFAFFPFSSGSRNCIGQHLADMQSKIAVIHLLKRYKEIKLQQPAVRYQFTTTYAPQKMMTAFIK